MVSSVQWSVGSSQILVNVGTLQLHKAIYCRGDWELSCLQYHSDVIILTIASFLSIESHM